MTFADAATEDIYDETDSKAARKLLPRDLWRAAIRKLDYLRQIESLHDLKGPAYQLEALKGDRKGHYSLRINRQYRICFVWSEEHREPLDVEIVDYH